MLKLDIRITRGVIIFSRTMGGSCQFGLHFYSSIIIIFAYFACAQQQGAFVPEIHPQLSLRSCKAVGQKNNSSSNSYHSIPSSCSTEPASLVLDANWRWMHKVNDYTSCMNEASWDSFVCPDPITCAQGCALEGVDYSNNYGVSTHASTSELKFKVNSNVGSRLFMLEGSKYKMFKLKNREFSVDVDVSQLPCGLNGAVYFVEMPEDGGTSKYPNNKAGANYGTGYCDAQCPRDIKFINGEANNKEGSNFSKGGHYGSCCMEMDIWEANTMASAYTTHTCNNAGLTRCEGSACDTACDKVGCDLNPYRIGSQFFYGPGMGYQLDSTKPFSVVTQFITADNTDQSPLTEIRRFYVQNGKIIENPSLKFGTSTSESLNALSDKYCATEASIFNGNDVQHTMGGLAAMGAALDRGMVLTLSIWDDPTSNMLWLDSDYPLGQSPSQPGVARGACPTSSGKPEDVESQYGNSIVKYMNIKYGPIGTTLEGI